MAHIDKEMSKLENEKKLKKQELENANLESQQLKHDRTSSENDYSLAEKAIRNLLQVNPWIPDQEQYSFFYFEKKYIIV